MSDPGQGLLDDLLAQERRLRAWAEAEAKAYRKLLVHLAQSLDPARVDARRRVDPLALHRLSPQEWRTLFDEILLARQAPARRWPEPEPPTPVKAEAKPESDPVALDAVPAEVVPVEAIPAEVAPVEVAPVEAAPVEVAPAQDEGPAFPPQPPSRFGNLFEQWPREGLVLYLLATTGWSLRHAIDEALAERLAIGPGSGSIKRLFRRLEKLGLVSSGVYDLGGVRAATLTLTEQGRVVAGAAGFPAIPSDWQRLMAAHGGERQALHAALCCAVAYQARQRGYTVTVCPPVDGPASPDLALHSNGQSLYLEVEAESGSPERRMIKWRNQADLQGFVALCANNIGVRERLAAEARAASPHGLATDLASLIRPETPSFWVDRWGRVKNDE